MATLTGTVEIITGTDPNTTSEGITFVAISTDLVPTFASAKHPLTNIQPAPTCPDKPLMVAAWTAENARFQPVRILLWAEPEPEPLNGGTQ